MNLTDSFQNRLKKAMELNNMKQVDLVEKTGLDKTLINKYLAGISNARQKNLTILADVLNVNEVWLIGYDVPMERTYSSNAATPTSAVVHIYGTIPAGVPMECIEDIIDTEEIPADMLKGGKQYFGLRVKGDSMFPDYLDGDTLIIEKTENCESGNDCIVMVNGNDGTFKRVFKNETGIILQPLNPTYAPMVYSNEQILSLPVKVLGVVVELRRKKK